MPLRPIGPRLIRWIAPVPYDMTPPIVVEEEFAYGAHPLQRYDLYRAVDETAAAPLVVFCHGGGWRAGDKARATGFPKINHFLRAGWAFATTNYRLLPDTPVEDQARDVAAALAHIVAGAGAVGVDADRIVLMGHSAGAHLLALVATDRRYAEEAGLDRSRLRGAVLLDGAAYDVPLQMRGRGLDRRLYVTAFRGGVERQRALSPALIDAAPEPRRFLLLNVQRPGARAQTEAMAEALRRHGADVTAQEVADRGLKGHLRINRHIGFADYPPTILVDEWMRRAIN